MPKENSAGAIIFREDPPSPEATDGQRGKKYYLLLHYAPSEPGKRGHWEFPKGHIEDGETDRETIRREVEEETGIKDIKIIPDFKQYIKYFFRKSYGLKGEARKKAPWVFKLVVFFIAETNTKEIVLSDEHVGFAWLAYEDAFKKLTFKNAKELLKKSNDFINAKCKFQNEK